MLVPLTFHLGNTYLNYSHSAPLIIRDDTELKQTLFSLLNSINFILIVSSCIRMAVWYHCGAAAAVLTYNQEMG